MSKVRFTLNILAVGIFMLTVASVAQAQASRTWVSGVGDDANPCSRTAPCKTFAGAISKTAANGEIDALDPGGFGAVTITKSITIDGTNGAGFGSILASLVNGININDGGTNTISVKLRNLSIDGFANGLNGINYISGGTVHVENCRIFGFTGDGIRKAATAAGRLIVQDTTITDCASDAIELAGTNALNDAVSLEHVNISRCGNGVRVSNRASVAISNSVFAAINATASSAAVIISTAVAGGGIVDLENCQVNFNSVGVQPNAGNTVRLSNAHMTGNGNALNFNGGTIASFQNNRIAGNAGGENFAALTDIIQQ